MVSSKYDRIERWLIGFYEKAATQPALRDYYSNAASGLSIALQEIDRERYDRTSREIWDNYQKLKEEHDNGLVGQVSTTEQSAGAATSES